MSQNDRGSENTSGSVNNAVVSEIPGRPFSLSMEISLFSIMFSVSLGGTALSNIILYRTCVHSLNYNEGECRVFLQPEKNNDTNRLEEEVQKYYTMISTIRMLLESIGPAIVSFFLGGWSDTYGRKPLITWPLLGITLTSIMTVVYSMLDNLGPWWYIPSVIPFALTGGFTAMFTGAFCYVSDVTSSENRSLRMAVLEGSVSIGMVLGSVLSSYLLKMLGNIYLLLLVATLNVLVYAYTNIWLIESLNGALQGTLSTLLDFLLVKEMMETCFKRRPNNMRRQILLLTFANSLAVFILYGLSNLEYLYAREKIHWAMRDYTIYSASGTLISFIVAFLCITLLQKILGVTDLILAIVGFLSITAEFIVKTLAITSWHMYLAAGVGSFKSLSAPLIRSLLTKILPIEDIAKVFSLMCAIEGLCPLLSPVIYNSLYAYTITVFPAAVYVLSAAITAACLIMLGFVQYDRCKTSTTYQPLPVEASI